MHYLYRIERKRHTTLSVLERSFFFLNVTLCHRATLLSWSATDPFFNATPWHRATLLSQSPAWQAFPCGLGANNEERGSKTARKMAQVTERGRGLPMAQSDTTLGPRALLFLTPPRGTAWHRSLGTRPVLFFFLMPPLGTATPKRPKRYLVFSLL